MTQKPCGTKNPVTHPPDTSFLTHLVTFLTKAPPGLSSTNDLSIYNLYNILCYCVTLSADTKNVSADTSPRHTTWTADKLQQYGGKIEWKGSESGETPSTTAIADCLINLDQSVFCYDGKAKTPSVTVYHDSSLLRKDIDYSVKYSNNTKAGNGSVTITGMGNYAGSVTKSFRIVKKEAAAASGTCGENLEWSVDNNGVLTITGSGPMDNWTRTEPGPWSDYKDSIKSVIISDGVTTIGDYAFYGFENIESAMIGNTVEEIGDSAFCMTYSLSEICIPDSVKTIHNAAFSAGGLDKVVLGNGVTHIGDYAFGNNLGITEIVLPESLTYLGAGALDGNPVKKIYFGGEAPEFGDRIYLNDMQVTVYYPEWSETWDESARNSVFLAADDTWKTWNPGDKRKIDQCTAALNQTDYTYTGKAIIPVVSITDAGTALVEGKDFSVTLKDNTNAGTASIAIKGIGKYTGTIEKTFTITPKAITPTVTLSKTTFTYNGKAQKPSVTVKSGKLTLTKGTDYTVSYKNNVNPGTASVTVKCIGNYSGQATKKFTIKEEIKTGWQTIDGAKYYYDNTGVKLTGMQTIDGAQYYFDSDGVMQTGMQTIDSAKYYFDGDGVMQTGWQTIDGAKYYFDEDGAAHIGWLQYGGKWYYFRLTGVMHTGTLCKNGKYYYLKKDGTRLSGWLMVAGKTYYHKLNGERLFGWLKVNGKMFYFKTNGEMLKGWLSKDGKKYYFKTNGQMHTGWLKLSGKYYYFKANGQMVTGRYKVGNKWYTFNKNGVRQ